MSGQQTEQSLLLGLQHHVAAAPVAFQRNQTEYFTEDQAVADDVELNIFGFGPMHGTWRGRKDVVEATRRNFGLLSNQQPEIEDIISQGDRVAILLRETGTLKSDGQAYSVRGVQWFTFADGKIKKIDEILASIWKS